MFLSLSPGPDYVLGHNFALESRHTALMTELAGSLTFITKLQSIKISIYLSTTQCSTVPAKLSTPSL